MIYDRNRLKAVELRDFDLTALDGRVTVLESTPPAHASSHGSAGSDQINYAGASTPGGAATHIAGGGAGQIPYQSAASTTAMLAAGTSGQYLKSNGTSAPSWDNPTAVIPGLKIELMFSYKTTDTLSFTAGKVEVNDGSTSVIVTKAAGDLDVSSMSNGQWKFICTTQDGTLSLETATGAGSVRPSDTCFTYNGGTGSFLNLGKYGYYFSATKRIIAAVHQVSTTSFYIINLGSGIEEWGKNSRGSWRIDADGKLEQWGSTANAAYTSARSGLYYVIFASASYAYPISFIVAPDQFIATPANAVGDWGIGCCSTGDGSATNIPSTMVTGYASGTGVSVRIDWHAIGRWKK